MDQIEFTQRVYANPAEPEQELLDAASANPALQKILDEAQQMEGNIGELLSGIVVPEGLEAKLLALANDDAADADPQPNLVDLPAANSSFFHYYAIAASVLLVLGVTFTLNFNSGPSAPELAIAEEAMRHIYAESSELALIDANNSNSNMNWAEVDLVMANAGVQLASNVSANSAVFYANPCIIIPEYSSAHLMMQGNRGAVNVFVIQNSPVTSEYQLRDERFDAMVVPMEQGNLILIGEDGENLEQFKELISGNMEWTI